MRSFPSARKSSWKSCGIPTADTRNYYLCLLFLPDRRSLERNARWTTGRFFAYGFILSRALYGLSIECFPHSQQCPVCRKRQSRGIVIAFMIAYIVILSGHADVRHSGSDSGVWSVHCLHFCTIAMWRSIISGNYRGYCMLLCSGV